MCIRDRVNSVFASLAKDNRLLVGEMQLSEPKTKLAQQWLADHDLAQKSCLVIVEHFDESVFLATRNLPRVNMITYDEICPRTLLLHENVLVHPDVIAKLEEIYS